MLVAVLSAASKTWNDAMTIPIKYAHDPVFHGEEAVTTGGPKYSEFVRKLDGLIFQFCGSSPAELASAILQAASEGRWEGRNKKKMRKEMEDERQ
jgi:hypothetical protein